jgi:hypothetical protein
MKLALDLVIACGSPKEARSLEAALSPDNKSVPKDQTFSSELDGARLRFLISSPRASSCVSSALGILGDAKLFQEIWSISS